MQCYLYLYKVMYSTLPNTDNPKSFTNFTAWVSELCCDMLFSVAEKNVDFLSAAIKSSFKLEQYSPKHNVINLKN